MTWDVVCTWYLHTHIRGPGWTQHVLLHATMHFAFSLYSPTMSLPTFLTYLPLLWVCATASPAGGSGPTNQYVMNAGRPPWWPDSLYPSGEGFTPAAPVYPTTYTLRDTYDSSNWLNKFDVQAVSQPLSLFSIAKLLLTLPRCLIPHVCLDSVIYVPDI
jgi:hypothetical protein